MSTPAARPTETALNVPSPGEVLFGKYAIERVLGVGGMGTVVAATHLELGQPVAIKFMQPEIAEREARAERFIREARAAASIRSDHVGRVLDVGTTPSGLPYIVMEYLEGLDLAELMACTGQLPVDESLSYVLEACEAIAEAHARGIVHRDIKPENLFLAERPDGSRIVKVLDFGISKSVTSSEPAQAITNPTFSIGSPPYMAPEQVRSPADVDARTDIWSLGATLYEMLAGQPPFLGETPAQTLALVLEANVPPLREYRPEVPEQLEEVILRCLQKDRAKRWSSLDELAAALGAFAPVECEVSVERVARLLGRDPPRSRRPDSLRRGALGSMPSGPPSGPRSGVPSTPGVRVARLDAITLPAGPEVDPSASRDPNNNSASIAVSTTRRESSAGRPRRKRGWLGWAAVLVLAGAGGFAFLHRDRLPADVSALTAAAGVTPEAQPPAAPEPEPPAAAEAPAPPPAPAAEDVAEEAAAPEPAPPAPTATVAPAKAAPPRGKPVPPPPRAAAAAAAPKSRASGTPSAAPAAPPPPSSSSQDAWDRGSFGGRR